MVGLETVTLQRGQVEVQATVKYPDKDEAPAPVEQRGEHYRVALDGLPDTVHLFVLDRGKKQLIDWASVYPSEEKQPSQIEVSRPRARPDGHDSDDE